MMQRLAGFEPMRDGLSVPHVEERNRQRLLVCSQLLFFDVVKIPALAEEPGEAEEAVLEKHAGKRGTGGTESSGPVKASIHGSEIDSHTYIYTFSFNVSQDIARTGTPWINGALEKS